MKKLEKAKESQNINNKGQTEKGFLMQRMDK
jgi:hypothetical protein